MKKKYILFSLFLFSNSLILFCDEGKSNERFINTLLPGYYQIENGNLDEGVLYMCSVPISIAGLLLSFDYFYTDEFIEEAEFFVKNDDQHYFLYSPNMENLDDEWKFYLGSVLSVYGLLLYNYSQYDAYYNEGLLKSNTKKIELHDAILAPWIPENTINYEVLPPLILSSGVLAYKASSAGTIKDFFSRENVSFLGRSMSPTTAISSVVLSSILFVTANAAWEEIAMRGILLQRKGLNNSSIQFGFTHMANAISPNVSLEKTIWQSLLSTAFGYYSGYMTINNEYDIRKAIAYHFWNNVITQTLNYIEDPDNSMMFSIQFNYSF